MDDEKFASGTWRYDYDADHVMLDQGIFNMLDREDTGSIRTLQAFQRIVHREDIDLVSDERLASLAHTGSHKTYLRLLGGNGRCRTILCDANFLNEPGKGLHFAGTMRDVTKTVLPDLPAADIHAFSQNIARQMDYTEKSRLPLLLMDRNRKVIYSNRIANFFANKEIFRIRKGSLYTRYESDQRKLESLLYDICEPSATKPLAQARSIVLQADSRYPIVITGQSLAERFVESTTAPTAVMTVFDFSAFKAPTRFQLKSVFGLTEAEVRLSTVLMDRFKLNEAADTLSISYETARTQIKSVFLKTGTRNQAELLVILERLSSGVAELATYV